LKKAYAGTTISGTGTYSILGQEEYVLDPQVSHRCFLWHEEYGYPYKLHFLTDQDFLGSSVDRETESTPEAYRMWGEDWAREQPKQASTLSISSSETADTNIEVTVFGIVSGYPDFETITTNASNGTTSVAGLKSFTSIERVTKASSSTGRITVTSDSGNTTVAVLPVGDSTSGIQYKKVRLYPLPDEVIPVNVWYYKDPWRLVNNNDIHELGDEFDESIILLATAKMLQSDNKFEADATMREYRRELNSLRRTNVDKIDWFPKLERPWLAVSRTLVHRNLSFRQIGSHFGPSCRF
jgi:hypothetical protein